MRPDPHFGPTYQIIQKSQRLRRMWDAKHGANSDISRSERAVLDYLVIEGSATVPHIAKHHAVSRQHIQVTADGLAARGLVQFTANPKHKSSRLLDVTMNGERAHARATKFEAETLTAIEEVLDESTAKEVEKALDLILAVLRDRI